MNEKISFKEHKKNIKRLINILWELDHNYIKLVMVVHVINAITPYLTLLLSSYVLDGIVEGKSFIHMLQVTAVVLGAVFVLEFIASTVWNKAEVRREKMYNVYSTTVEMKMLSMDFSRIDSPEVSKLKERIRRDLNWGWGINTPIFAMNSILYGVLNMIAALVVGFPIVITMVETREYRALAIFAALAVLAYVILRLNAHYTKVENEYMFSDIKDEDKEEMTTFIWGYSTNRESLRPMIENAKLYNGYDLLRRWTLEPLNSKKNLEREKNGSIGMGMTYATRQGLSSILNGGAYLIVVVVALAGGITAGNVVALAGSLSRMLTSCADMSAQITRFALEAKKQISTIELMELEDEMYKGKLPVEKRSDNQYQIEFRNVSFQYPGSEEYVLKDFSLKLNIGEKLAIVGMNGSGKTTMIKLLCRLYDVSEGEILLNGVNIKKFDQEEYRKLFSIVFQDFNILPYTIAQNVAADMEYEKEKVLDCLEKAGFGERLRELEAGCETYVAKDYESAGVEFSGGELQKLAIARAIYRDAPFILLDEPTAALDPIAEYEIYSNFDKIIGTKTAIYISHRLSSCRFCKNIAVFHEGRLVQQGAHEELLKDRDGKYFEMWNAQAQYYQ